MSDERVLDTLRRVSAHLTAGDMDHTLEQITSAAVEVLPGADYASITVLHTDGRLTTTAPTDEILLDLDAGQYELHEGPCYEAAAEVAYVTSPHLAADDRFPRYAPLALEAGIRAQAGIPLFDTPGDARGALNVYSRDVGNFTELDFVSRLFAHQATIALDYARELGNLQEAVRTRQLIGRAVGIVMERYSLSEDRAFGFLARLSQTRNVKLRLVAQELVEETEAQAGS